MTKESKHTPCGCKVWEVIGEHGLRENKISYCAKHGAVDELLEALETIASWRPLLNDTSISMRDIAQEAIKKARREES